MAISYEMALRKISTLTPIKEQTTLPLNQALNKVLALDIKAKKALPSFNNSAMDGYAIKFSEQEKKLKIAAKVFAGHLQKPILKENECYKITTGAKVPEDADTIVPKENCSEENGFVTINQKVKKGNALRLKGEEIQKEQLLLQKGEILDAAKLALLASQGIWKVNVFKPLKIAIISSGDELKEPWEEASEDEIYNINAINIQMHLKQMGFESDYIGHLKDDLNEAISKIATLKEYDVIISSGGVSVGEADFTKKAFLANGFCELFHGVKIKPGHPIMVGVMDKSLVLALPGNPLAAIVTFLLVGQVALFQKQGAKFTLPLQKVKSAVSLQLKGSRVNTILGNYQEGYFYPYKNNKYGSGMIMPLVKSNFLAIINEGIYEIEKDQEIEGIFLCS